MSRCTAISGAFLLALAGSGCTGIGVNLGTEKPLAVDINMKVDVYQHTDTTVQKKVAAATNDLPVDVRTRRKNRMGEVQVMKNNRTVGENHLGLLHIMTLPPGDYGVYVKHAVDAENEDRLEIMNDIAKKDNLPLDQVEAEHARLAANRAFNGEWIEIAQSDGSFSWVQKGSEKATPAKPTPTPAASPSASPVPAPTVTPLKPTATPVAQ